MVILGTQEAVYMLDLGLNYLELHDNEMFPNVS